MNSLTEFEILQQALFQSLKIDVYGRYLTSVENYVIHTEDIENDFRSYDRKLDRVLKLEGAR